MVNIYIFVQNRGVQSITYIRGHFVYEHLILKKIFTLYIILHFAYYVYYAYYYCTRCTMRDSVSIRT